MANTHNKLSCPVCGRALNNREVVLYEGMVTALSRVYNWIKSNGKPSTLRFKDFSSLLDANEVQRFRDWKYFAPDMVSGPHGMFIFNVAEIGEFLSGRKEIPTHILKNRINNTISRYDYRTVSGILPLYTLLENGQMMINYKDQPILKK